MIINKIHCVFPEELAKAGVKTNLTVEVNPEINEILVHGDIAGPIPPPKWLRTGVMPERAYYENDNSNTRDVIEKIAEVIKTCAPPQISRMTIIVPGYVSDEVEKNIPKLVVSCGKHYHIYAFDKTTGKIVGDKTEQTKKQYQSLEECIWEAIGHQFTEIPS